MQKVLGDDHPNDRTRRSSEMKKATTVADASAAVAADC